MGKKKNGSTLGRSLIKERFKNNHGRKMVSDTMLHTTEMQDGYDWGRLNLQSVTEESSFQEFLSTAELAGTEFQAEKLNIKFINPKSNVGLLSNKEMETIRETHNKHKENLKIPRRPHWDANTTPDELDKTEKQHFLEWRRSLAHLQEDKGILLTPYEKNLEFWRQLWRVVERSDVVVQIVDARNPLLFRCEDLEAYVKEVSENKLNLILINKSDFLTNEQRKHWATYFSMLGVKVLFFSAELASKNENNYPDEQLSDNVEEEDDDASIDEDDDDSIDEDDDLIDELDKTEKQHFLEWRRSLAHLPEEEGILLKPYEKNLGFWRQLWRVVERNNVILQTADARNPLLFTYKDLEAYVKEVSENKSNLLLIKKSDVLTNEQRPCWATHGMKILFFSAELASENENNYLDEQLSDNVEEEDDDDSIDEDDDDSIDEYDEEYTKNFERIMKMIAVLKNAVGVNTDAFNIFHEFGEILCKNNLMVKNSSILLNSKEVIDLFKTIHTGPKVTDGITTIGLVGYPNVGKSSTINALMSCKKVSVSATPGKTKHFQTLYLEKDLLLCDCPGLVMPSFVFTKAEMILNGILPVDQMRDHVPPVNLVTSLIPRYVLEDKYGIMIPKPLEGEDEDRAPTAEEFLNAYAYNRGFMTANGQPDNARAARYILKDFINGKLLFCNTTPIFPQKAYHTWPERQRIATENKVVPPRAVRAVRPYHVTTEELDKGFFNASSQGVHTKGVVGKSMLKSSDTQNSAPADGTQVVQKPWKQHNKHKNKGKKEKLRRVYAHLDQH